MLGAIFSSIAGGGSPGQAESATGAAMAEAISRTWENLGAFGEGDAAPEGETTGHGGPRPFSTIEEIFRAEFGKIFTPPRLGPLRMKQERIDALLEKFQTLMGRINEFTLIFLIPYQEANAAMVERISQQGEAPDKLEGYRDLWIEILEERCMALLGSEEYTRLTGRITRAMAAFRKARDEFFFDIMSDLPVPTDREMDRLYKEFHLLKKQVRDLARNQSP
jgi:hypothetical protein